MVRETETAGSTEPWIVNPEKLGVDVPTRVPFPLSPFAVQGELPASEEDMTQLMLGLYTKWVEIDRGEPWYAKGYQPFILDLDFKDVTHISPKVVSDVLPFCVGVLNGRQKPVYAVYSNLGGRTFAELHDAYGEFGRVAVARQEGHDGPTLIGLRRKIERYLGAYKALSEVGEYVDGGPFSRAVLGHSSHSARLLNEMSADGIVIHIPHYSPNHSYFRAVA